MTTSRLSVSQRSTLRRWFLVLVIAGLAVTAVAGVLAYNPHTGDHTTTEERSAGSWDVDATFDHGAVVQTDTQTFAAGERLENRQLYFTAIAPALDTTYTVSHTNSDGVAATASATLTLVVRSVETIDGQEVIHWQNSTELARVGAASIPDGGEQTVDATVGIEEITERIDAIEGELGAAPGTSEVLIRAETSAESSLGAESISDTRTDSLVIEPGTGIYRVESDVGPVSSTTATESVTVTDEPSAVWLYGPPALAGGALLSVGWLVGLRARGSLKVTDTERTHYEFEATRTDSAQWISRGQVPDLGDRTTIPVEDLEALVDVAIDSDRRVLEDTDSAQFVVLVDDIAYQFTPPTGDDSPATAVDGSRSGEATEGTAPSGGDGSGQSADDEQQGDEPPDTEDGAATADNGGEPAESEGSDGPVSDWTVDAIDTDDDR